MKVEYVQGKQEFHSFLQVYWRLPNIPSNSVLSGKIGRSVWHTIHYHLPIGS